MVVAEPVVENQMPRADPPPEVGVGQRPAGKVGAGQVLSGEVPARQVVASSPMPWRFLAW